MARRPQPASLEDMAALLHRDIRGPGWSVLTWMAEAGFLTNDLVSLRFYPTAKGVRSATYRMAQLASWGLIARRRLRKGRQVWHLTDQGARLVADYLRKTPRELGYDGREAIIHEAFVRHSLEVTRFEVALRIHARIHGGEVTRFGRELPIQTDAGVIKPDAVFTYTEAGRSWTYLVEIDRNTETPAYFAATKVPRYDAMARGPWELYFEQIPTCLVVATAGKERIQRLKDTIDALPIGGGDYRLFKFVNASDLYDMQDSHLHVMPEVVTRFAEPVCLAARKSPSERRAVLA